MQVRYLRLAWQVLFLQPYGAMGIIVGSTYPLMLTMDSDCQVPPDNSLQGLLVLDEEVCLLPATTPFFFTSDFLESSTVSFFLSFFLVGSCEYV